MRGTPYLFKGFTGGLNSVAAPYELARSETRECLNVVSTERGSIRKRFGSTLFTSSEFNVELTSMFSTTIEYTPWIIASSGSKIYSITTTGIATEIGKGFTAGSLWSFVHAPHSTEVPGQGVVYMTNGIDPPQQWSGTGEVKPWTSKAGETFQPTVPNGQFMVLAGSRIWMTGVKTDPAAVFFSAAVTAGEGGEIGDPSLWPKENVVRFESKDGLPITGIGLVGPYIVVFKETKTWIVHDLNTGANRRLSDSIGCVAQRSIAETNQGTFFLTADQGVYVTNGSNITEASYPVRPTIGQINPEQREKAAGVYHNNHYYLSYASGSSNVPNRTLDYDLQLKSWWLHDLAVNEWTKYEPITGHIGLYGIPPRENKGVVACFVEGVYEDSGHIYTGKNGLAAYWLGPWDPFAYYVMRHRLDAPFLKKRIRQVFFDGEGEIIPIVARNFSPTGTHLPATVANKEQSKPDLPVNFGAGGQVFGNPEEEQTFGGEELHGTEMLFGGVAQVQAARMYSLGVGRTWSVGYGNNSAEPFVVFSYALMASFRKS